MTDTLATTTAAECCGNCGRWRRWPGEGVTKGTCYGAPPTRYASGECRRPETHEKDPGCAFHKDGTPPVFAKVNPETPGAAAKAARKGKPALEQPNLNAISQAVGGKAR